MKKGNRVLALFLAAVMLVTSIAWDFSDASVVEAEETTSANPAYLEYDFESMTDITKLNDDFTAHTQGVTGSTLVEENWFLGTGEGNSEVVASNVGGLKLKQRGTSVQYLKHKNTYENYHVTVEMYPDTNTCILVGEEPTSAGISANSDPKFMVWASSATQFNWRGAGQKTVNLKTGFSAGNAYTVHIRMENRVLTAWIEGTSHSVTIGEAVNTLPTESYICIRQKRNNDSTTAGKYGGYKSLTIRDLDASYAEGYYDFDNADTSVLTAFTSTQYDKTEKTVIGDAQQAVSAHWYTGKSASLEIDAENSVAHTSTNVGLKPLASVDNTYNHFLTYNRTYRDFEASVELYARSNIGVVLGGRGVYPTSSDSEGIMLWFTGGTTLAMLGAFDTSKVTLAGDNATFTGTTTCNFGFCDTQPTDGDVITLNVKMQDGVLTLNVEGNDEVLSIATSNVYPTDTTIALWTRNYLSNAGGYKSFSVKSNDKQYVNFDNIDVTELDEAGYTSTKFDKSTGSFAVVDGEENQLPSTHWVSGSSVYGTTNPASKNIGLKPSTTDDNTRYYLNTPYLYKNFELSTEIYWGSNSGVVIGKESAYATALTAPSIRIQFANNRIQINGAIDVESSYVSGDGTWGNGTTYISYYFGDAAKTFKATNGKSYTMNVRLEDGILTVWVDGYDSVLTVSTSEYFESESIALIQRSYDGDDGGFRSLEVNCLDDAYVNFDNIDVSMLDEQGYTATQFDKNDSYAVIEANQPVSSYWFSGTSTTRADETTLTSSNTGIKANVTDSEKKAQLLNTPHRYENFTATTEIYWGVNAGFIIGADNVYPRDITNYPAISVCFANNRIQLGGALDYATASVTGTGASFSTYATNTGIFYFTSGFTATTNNVYTLNVEMKDGILTVWVDGYEGVLTLRVADHYESGRVALMHHKYDGDGGGFKSFEINEIETLSKLYTPAEFATYRSTNGHTAPEYHDYLFAGWFYDQECTQNVKKSVTTVTQSVYAKFVSSDILTIRAQISGTLEDNLATNDGTGSIRFITTVDTLKYSEVGFLISYDKDGDGVPITVPFSSNEVYEKLYAVDYSDGDTIKYVPSEEFCASSAYFKACTVRKVGQDYYDMEFTVTPFWITSDGTTVEGETAVKTIDERWVRNVVYISDGGSDDAGLGTPNRPYATVNNAISQVVNDGIVYVSDTCTIQAGDVWKAHNKRVTISGAQEDSASVLQVASDWTQTFCIKDAVTFENITFQLLSDTYKAVYAEGHKLTIEENVVVSGVKEIYGGSRDSNVGSTDLNLYAGTYEKIYGGSNYKTVTGNTRVTVGGRVNEGISSGTDWSKHNHVYMLYGGSYNGSVGGNTYVTVEGGTEFIYIYGGGHLSGSKVTGSTNVTFEGKAMSIYGGSYYGTNANTNVVINNGYVQQVFGGCEATSMEGNVNVQVLGGEVARRLYGGCYNDYGTYNSTTESLWASNYYVSGHINVVIGEGANLSLATDSDNGLLAISRYKTTTQGEWGTLVFNEGTYDESKVGSDCFDTQPYHYLVKATSGGIVTSEGGCLNVTPGSGYSATVMNETSNTEITVNENGTYTLPEIDKDSKVVITVTFNEIN